MKKPTHCKLCGHKFNFGHKDGFSYDDDAKYLVYCSGCDKYYHIPIYEDDETIKENDEG